MQVSVIIPAFNVEATLGDTLASLTAQTSRSWEAVVVDDGSHDDTAAVAESFASSDARVRLIRQANGGEAAARNAGVAAARSEWLLFLDADDWIEQHHIERMTSALTQDPSLDAVHCRYARVTPAGHVVPDAYQPPTGDMFATWARRSAFPVHACLVRRALVDEVGGFDTSLRKSADWDLWQRIARTGAKFGAVPETLCFYRMRPDAASMDARSMFIDGLRVIRRGHAPDPRVPRPAPQHANGAPADGVRTQAWYLLSWCAGLQIGRGFDARELVDCCDVDPFAELDATAVARCIFDAAPLPLCQSPDSWPTLWPQLRDPSRAYLTALEHASGAPDLAVRAATALEQLVLDVSGGFPGVLAAVAGAERLSAELQSELARRDAALEAALLSERQSTAEAARHEQDALRLRELADASAAAAAELARLLDAQQSRAACLQQEADGLATHAASLENQSEKLMTELAELRDEIKRLRAEHNALLHAPERRVGHAVLHDLRLARPIAAAGLVTAMAAQRASNARLAWDRRRTRTRPRIAAGICSNFPIYSQTFVYEELVRLAGRGYEIRHIFSRQDAREQLGERYAELWAARSRMCTDYTVHRRNYEYYRRRLAGRVQSLIHLLTNASGMPAAELERHGNFLEAFTFTRMVEAYRPHYLHSYFFYDRSLMTLVASYLLGIPRGMSCYADHVLDDYELKVVPLHMQLCDIVIATSNRIRGELLALAPAMDPNRIIVKPNGIDASRFPALQRSEPVAAEPFRLLTVCRIEPKKGLLELVEAMHILRERGVTVEAHIVGAPDDWNAASVEYKRRLDQRIGELGLWGVVHLEGRQDHDGLLKFQRLAHMFVAPFVETANGDKDGIPTALLEGMASGLPVVATDAGSITEVVESGVDGVIVPQRDAAALANAIDALLADPGRRAALGHAGARSVRDRFDVAECEAVFHDRLEQVLRGKGAP